jgi:hypothetical protein
LTFIAANDWDFICETVLTESKDPNNEDANESGGGDKLNEDILSES